MWMGLKFRSRFANVLHCIYCCLANKWELVILSRDFIIVITMAVYPFLPLAASRISRMLFSWTNRTMCHFGFTRRDVRTMNASEWWKNGACDRVTEIIRRDRWYCDQHRSGRQANLMMIHESGEIFWLHWSGMPIITKYVCLRIRSVTAEESHGYSTTSRYWPSFQPISKISMIVYVRLLTRT